MHKRLFGWVVFIGLAVMLFLLLNKNQSQYAPISLSDFDASLKKDEVRHVTIGNDNLYGEFRTPQAVGSRGEKVERFRVELLSGTSSQWIFTEWLLDNRGSAQVYIDKSENLLMQFILPLIPWLLIFGFIWFFVFRRLKPAGAQTGDPLRVFVVNQPGQPDIESKNPSM